MSKVGDIIEKGGTTPDDVTGVRDGMDDDWVLTSRGHWHISGRWVRECEDGVPCRGNDSQVVLGYAPLRVTAVREPERKVERAGWPEDEVVHYRIPGDASPLTLCGLDVWADDTSVTERAGSSNCPACREAADEDKPAAPERKLIGPPHAHRDAPCTDECYEPSPKPGSVLLDLVRQYGVMCVGFGGAVALGHDGSQSALDKQFARIAALVPQHADPVKATQRALLDEIAALLDVGAYDDLAAEVKRLLAPADPSVLSLPPVPPGTVALIGVKTGRRFSVDPHGWRHDAEGWITDLGMILSGEGSVSVVMREPRTWPRLDAMPEGLRRVEVRQPDGMQFTATRRQDDRWAGDIASGGNAEALEPFECYTWGELLGEGDVTEVFE